MSFENACAAAAEMIKAGGLEMKDKNCEETQETLTYSQVDSASWEPLAAMNQLLCLTDDSQDAPDGEERAYVCAHLRTDLSGRLVKNIQMDYDLVAWEVLTVPIHDDPAGPAPWRSIPVTKCGEGFCSNIPLFYSELYKASQFADVVLVHIVDPVWGRVATGPDGLFTRIVATLEALEAL
jgi:hypothetical protein